VAGTVNVTNQRDPPCSNLDNRGPFASRPSTDMPKLRKHQSFRGLKPASVIASRLAASTSRKRGTACEVSLCRTLRTQRLKFRVNVVSLPGCPDIVFQRERIAIFADGDFWHGRNLDLRIARLTKGHNSNYWVSKIRSNVARDRRVRRQLNALGWRVIRVWEGDIRSNIDRVTARILSVRRQRLDALML
jgi:DNA mismatch endonuclease, patch repair protein